jgi:uncharacterized protein (TIGR03083 family)
VSDPTAPGEGPPHADHLRFFFEPAATLTSVADQRRRFAGAVSGLGDAELAAPSRCGAWSVADVLRHGIWFDDTMRAIWSGDRSVALGFDPRRTPDEHVRSARGVADREVLSRYLASTEAVVTELVSAGPARFAQPSRSPAGPVPWWLSAVHLGWDTAIHERDVLLPLGRTVDADPAHSAAVLAYSLALASFFAGPDPLDVAVGGVRLRRDDGPVEVWAPSPAPSGKGAAEGGVAVVTGDPVAIVDALAGREGLPGAMDGPLAVVERLGGLARYFTSPV